MGDPPAGEAPDDQPGHDKKDPAATILKWIAVASGAVGLVTDILGWFR